MDYSDSHRLAQYGKSKGAIHDFIRRYLSGARCSNCHAMYVPALDIGHRGCRVHPRITSGESITPGHFLKYGNTVRSLPDRYACCGKSTRSEEPGCTRADHWTGAELWMPLYPGEARDDVSVTFNPGVGYDPSQYHAASWLHVLPTFLLPLMGRDVDDVIASTGAKEYTSLSSILGADGQGRTLVVNAGTHRLHVNLRDAYVHMTTTFGLPRECLACQQSGAHAQLLSSTSEALQETLRLAIPSYGRQPLTVAAAPSSSADALQELSKTIFGRTLGSGDGLPARDVRAIDGAGSRRAIVQRAEYLKSPDKTWKLIDQALEPLFLSPLEAFFPFIIFSWMDEEPTALDRMY